MKAQIRLGKLGEAAEVVLDGNDWADHVGSLTLKADAHTRQTLTLEVPVWEGVEVDGDMTVQVPEATHNLLVELGWTPPKEEQ